MGRLIVNADDLGYTEGINRAVWELSGVGALSSATVMATGAVPGKPPHASSSTLGIGCHIVLVDGLPAAPPEQIPSLLQGGRFRPSLGKFVADLQLGRIRDREIELEALAQMRHLQKTGWVMTHFDTHKHTHMFPRVLRPLLRAALQCGIGAVRNPFEPAWARAAVRRAPVLRRFQLHLLSRYRNGFLAETERAGIRTTSGALGVLATGTLDAPAIDSLLRAVSRHAREQDCYELVCHPGFHDAALDAQTTRLRVERDIERVALFDAIPRWTGEHGPHRLIRFSDV